MKEKVVECIKCAAELPENVIFCPECGTKIENTSSGVCSNCGENLKPKAQFCHNCGTPVKAGLGKAQIESLKEPEEIHERGVRRNWLSSLGPFLFIPIFAGIIVILFWKNKESEPIQTSDPMNAEQSMSSMAVMEKVRQTMNRLESNIQTNPKDLVSLDSLAQMYYIAGSFEKASKYYERHLEIEPDNKEIKMDLAGTYYNLKKINKAIELIQDVLKKEPTYAFGLYNLGIIYASTGNKEEALKNWKLLVQHHPGTEMAQIAQQRIHEFEHVEQSTAN